MNKEIIHISSTYPWLPPSMLTNIGKHWPAGFCDTDKKMFRKHKKIPASQWAEMYRYVTMSVLPGKWRNEVTPHLAGIMDASFFPSVQTVILCKAPQVGGPLSLETKIPTLNGWKLMRDISTGDVVFDEKGRQCNVISVSETFTGRDCFEITFSDGSKIISDSSHLWTVIDEINRKNPKTKTITTHEIALLDKKKEGRNRFVIPVALPLQIEKINLTVAPYALGVWLGDGNSASNQITTHDDDVQEMAQYINDNGHQCFIRKLKGVKAKASNIIIEPTGNKYYETCIRGHNLQQAGTFINDRNVLVCRECHRQHSKHSQYGFIVDPIIKQSFYNKLSKLNLINNKHIPQQYLRASYQQRLELLQGLMDTDGYIAQDGGRCEVTIAGYRLCQDIYELLATLGIKSKISTKICTKTGFGTIIKNPQIHYRISFTAYSDRPVFKLKRKLNLMNTLENAGRPTETRRRRIVNIKPVESVPVRCIGVDSESHLYLAGEAMIPTHNSESVNNCLGYIIDRDPGPVLVIYPDEITARENNQDRIQPMIKASPRLRSYMTGTDDDASMLRIKLSHMPIYMAWARSASRLANKPIRYVIFDEVDKYADTAGKREADPISLGEARTITYRHNRKVWKISTPTTDTGNIWKALTTEAQVIFDYWMTCPFCGNHHKMEFSQIQWAHKTEPGLDGKCHSEDPAVIESEKLAWYECPQCQAHWTDYDRDRAGRLGKWRDRNDGIELGEYLRVKKPLKIGFHLPSWISPFVSFSEIGAAFLRGKEDINKLKDFYNKHKAEPWKLYAVNKDEAGILASRCDLAPQTVPPSAVALTCGIDVQKHGFWFVVRAWTAELTSWNIHYGFLETWDDIEKLLYETAYPVSSDDCRAGTPCTPPEGTTCTPKTMRIFRACIDTGGGDKTEYMSMTEETYYWLIKNRGRGGIAVWGTKGASHPLPGMLQLGNAIISTPAGKKLPAALRILSVDTGKAKDQFHYRLELAAKDDTRHLPGAAFLHQSTGADYAAQILAEQKQITEKNVEEWVNIHQRANHLLDAEILAAVCAEMEFPGGGLRLLGRRQEKESEPKQPAPRREDSGTGWFRK